MERLKLENEEHAEELEKLKAEVAEAFEAFSDGTMSGAAFLEHLQVRAICLSFPAPPSFFNSVPEELI